jgi:hypothetical protein
MANALVAFLASSSREQSTPLPYTSLPNAHDSILKGSPAGRRAVERWSAKFHAVWLAVPLFFGGLLETLAWLTIACYGLASSSAADPSPNPSPTQAPTPLRLSPHLSLPQFGHTYPFVSRFRRRFAFTPVLQTFLFSSLWARRRPSMALEERTRSTFTTGSGFHSVLWAGGW